MLPRNPFEFFLLMDSTQIGLSWLNTSKRTLTRGSVRTFFKMLISEMRDRLTTFSLTLFPQKRHHLRKSPEKCLSKNFSVGGSNFRLMAFPLSDPFLSIRTIRITAIWLFFRQKRKLVSHTTQHTIPMAASHKNQCRSLSCLLPDRCCRIRFCWQMTNFKLAITRFALPGPLQVPKC